MRDLKIYIVIQDPKTKQDVSIRGNFEILRAFLSGVGVEILDPAQIEPQPIPELPTLPKPRKSAKRIPQRKTEKAL